MIGTPARAWSRKDSTTPAAAAFGDDQNGEAADRQQGGTWTAATMSPVGSASVAAKSTGGDHRDAGAVDPGSGDAARRHAETGQAEQDGA